MSLHCLGESLRHVTTKEDRGSPIGVPSALSQGALKGTNLRGQTEPKRRWKTKHLGSADFRTKTAGTRRKLQIGVCPLRFPFSAALLKLYLGVWRRGEIGKGCHCNTCHGDHT